MNLGPVAKALVGATLAGVAPYTAAQGVTSQGGAAVTPGEWLTVALAILIAAPLVWRADNLRWFKYAKAATAGLVVFLGVFAVALLSGETVTVNLVLDAILKTAASFGIVSQVPNSDRSEWHDSIGGDGEDEPVEDPYDGDRSLAHALDEDEPAKVTDLDGNTIKPDADGVTTLKPVDADGDGHDDANGQWMPGNSGRRPLARGGVIPGGSLALILGGAVTTQPAL